jgi:hypothetical protein
MQKIKIEIIAGVLLLLMAPVVALASPGPMLSAQPQATAEAAQRHAEAAQRTAWTAQATAQAAWGETTATAHAQAVATDQVATTHAQATRYAMAQEATRQAIVLQATTQALQVQGTRQAQSLALSATAQVAQSQIEGTRMAAQARREQAAADREVFLKPIRAYAPWALLVLLVVILGWTAVQAVPLVESYLIRVGAISDELSGSQTAPPWSPLDGEIIDLQPEQENVDPEPLFWP